MSFTSSAEVGIVWALNPEGEAWILKVGEITTHEYVENIPAGWTLVEGVEGGNLLIQVDSGYNSQVVGVSDTGIVYQRTGISKAEPIGSGWNDVSPYGL